MRKKILKSMIVLALAAVILTSLLICRVLYYYQFRTMQQEVKDKTASVAVILNDDLLKSLDKLDVISTGNRVTWIAEDGRVLYDNRSDVSQMENHLYRSEVDSALKTGFGEETRLSDTVGQQTYYYALRLDNGSVLRLAFTTDTVFSLFLSILPYILLVVCIVFMIAIILSVRQARHLVAPINAINLEKPMENEVYDEISPLLTRIQHLRRHIDQQVKDAKENQEQFMSITGNMSEGLVILNNKGYILSVNSSAIRFMGAKNANYTGRHILNLNRSLELQKVLEKVYRQNPVQEVLVLGNRSFRLLASPVVKDNTLRGALLIFQDITEAQKSETFRREFSANVSHELKTPLTVISGFAELLKNNLANQEDIPSFSDKIYTEAKRLIKLVDDIITISRLDEKDINMAYEEIDLLEMAGRVTERLQEIASPKRVTLSVSGDSVFVSVVPRLVDELIFNLCDNAIAYNREDGKVEISVYRQKDKAVLSVKDTGIGIPEEDQGRVFERFYRVDKSHSKQTGGTGLGLSIVKHSAQYHHAEISLESTVGLGTTITISFPL